MHHPPEVIKTFTLLIWEEVPETTKVVLIPNETLDEGDRAVLRTAHGHLINSVGLTPEQNRALDCLNNALCLKEEYLGPEHPVGTRWAMRWKDFIHDQKTPIEGKMISAAYIAGFIM